MEYSYGFVQEVRLQEAHCDWLFSGIKMQPRLENSSREGYFLADELASSEIGNPSPSLPLHSILILWIWGRNESCGTDCLGCRTEKLITQS